MDHKVLLAKSLTLLYQESKLKTDQIINSSDLIRTVLSNVQISELGIGLTTDRDTLLGLKSTILELCNNPVDYEYDRTDLIQRIKINCGYDDNLYDGIISGLNDDLTDKQRISLINNIKRSINNHFRDQTIEDVLSKATTRFKYNRDSIHDVNQFIQEIQAQLDPLQVDIENKDPAIIDDIDLSNTESVNRALSVNKHNNGNKFVYKTGWGALNRMLQGGLRPGDFVIIPALQHKYKTGFTLSLFQQIAILNTPRTTDPNKKPLLLRISFEDKTEDNLQFLYQSIKYDETGEYVEVENLTAEEMSSYIKAKLQVNGFSIRILRVDPSRWTYKSICNKILELEAQGYVVEVLELDYLSLVPTIGCIGGGVGGGNGTDIRDLFRRVRNFCNPRGIVVLTPHQLSTEAKQLIRSGVPEDQFVKMVNEKGYFSGCKQLDQEVDIELYIHIFKHNKKTYLSIQRGKHKIPTIIHNEDDKYCLFEFPKGMPIPRDKLGEDSSIRRLNSSITNASDDLFKLG